MRKYGKTKLRNKKETINSVDNVVAIDAKELFGRDVSLEDIMSKKKEVRMEDGSLRTVFEVDLPSHPDANFFRSSSISRKRRNPFDEMLDKKHSQVSKSRKYESDNNNSSGMSFSDMDESPAPFIKQTNDILVGGESQALADEFDFLVDGIDSSKKNSLNVRRASSRSLMNFMSVEDRNLFLRSRGLLPRFYEMFDGIEEDENTCLSALVSLILVTGDELNCEYFPVSLLKSVVASIKKFHPFSSHEQVANVKRKQWKIIAKREEKLKEELFISCRKILSSRMEVSFPQEVLSAGIIGVYVLMKMTEYNEGCRAECIHDTELLNVLVQLIRNYENMKFSFSAECTRAWFRDIVHLLEFLTCTRSFKIHVAASSDMCSILAELLARKCRESMEEIDLIVSLLRVLMNASNHNPVAASQIADAGAMYFISSLLQNEAFTVDLDSLVPLLGLVINLIEVSSRNRGLLLEMKFGDMNSLTFFLRRFEELQSSEKEEEDMYHDVLQAYLAMILALLLRNDSESAIVVKDMFESELVSKLLSVLKDFMAFQEENDLFESEEDRSTMEDLINTVQRLT